MKKFTLPKGEPFTSEEITYINNVLSSNDKRWKLETDMNDKKGNLTITLSAGQRMFTLNIHVYKTRDGMYNVQGEECAVQVKPIKCNRLFKGTMVGKDLSKLIQKALPKTFGATFR